VKVIEKKKLNKSQITIICLLAATVLLFVGYLAISHIISSRNTDTGNTGTNIPTVMPGESIYLNRPIAYPSVEEGKILLLEVRNENGEFGITRYPTDTGSFMFHYYTEEGEGEIPVPYLPPIYGAEGDFKYESLYSMDEATGYAYKLTYLLSAVGIPYFSERIELPSAEKEPEKRAALLKEYGLTQQSSYVYFKYADRDQTTGAAIPETEKSHLLIIGDKAASGAGYYFMVDNRDCVYYTGSEFFQYALMGFNEFVKGMLVSAGLSTDPGIAAALTTDFKTWVGTMFKEESDRVFTNDSEEYKKYENPEVIVRGDTYISIDKGADYVPDESFSSYEVSQNTNLRFNLEILKTHTDYNRIKKALVGKNVGSYVDNEIIITLINELYESDAKSLNFSEAEEIEYTYIISAIESVITDDTEKLSGIVEETDKLLKVTYRYTVGGVTTGYDCHGVIDLDNLSYEDASKLCGLSIGALSEEVSIRVKYTKENALAADEKFVLTGILSIYDEYGLQVSSVTEDTYVNISYYTVTAGSKSNSQTQLIRISDISDSSKLAPLKTILLGKNKGDFEEVVYSDKCYYEYMRDFVTYEISEIKYFVANEIIASFKYYNASEWDPYYGGETYYKNTLTNEYMLYGLNADSCEEVVKFLSGMRTDGNSTSAVGFSGQTVAVGLTLDNMEKYGLFAHKIYFELPRGIDVLEDESDIGSSKPTSDYIWLSTLGFTLYISDVDYDENGKRVRYIGSDMYDLIARVDAENFDFLEFSFVEFWASKNIIMVDIKNIEKISLEFEMSDLSGRYDFEIVMKDVYGGYINGDYYILEEEFSGCSKIEQQRVNVRPSDDAFDTELKRLASEAGEDWYSLTALYNNVQGGGEMTYYPHSYDTLGTAYFNSVYELLLLSRYRSNLTEEEKADAADSPRIFRMHFKISGKDAYYTYDFHRIDDRRIMVSLYRTDEDGNKIDNGMQVSDFYITTFAFKKLVNNYVALLNGETIDSTVGYPD